eukprot:g60267.t1
MAISSDSNATSAVEGPERQSKDPTTTLDKFDSAGWRSSQCIAMHSRMLGFVSLIATEGRVQRNCFHQGHLDHEL